jgi:hypothetical protein
LVDSVFPLAELIVTSPNGKISEKSCLRFESGPEKLNTISGTFDERRHISDNIGKSHNRRRRYTDLAEQSCQVRARASFNRKVTFSSNSNGSTGQR